MSKSLFLLLVLFTFNQTIVFAQKKTPLTSTAKVSAPAPLAQYFFDRDYSGGVAAGKDWLAKSADNPEIQAWYLFNLTRADAAAALPEAENFAANKGENKWTLMALAYAQSYNKPADSLPTAEKLIKLAPDDEEAIFVYHNALFRNNKYADSFIWLDKNSVKIKNQARLLTAKANSIFGFAGNDKNRIQWAFDYFAKAIAANPKWVDSQYLYGTTLAQNKQFNEAVPFLRKAAELSPKAFDLRRMLLETIAKQTGKDENQIQNEVKAEIDLFVKNNAAENSPEYLSNLAKFYEIAKDETNRNATEDKILQKFPNTKYDEETLYNRIDRMYKDLLKSLDINKMMEELSKMNTEKPDMTKLMEDSKKRLETTNAIRKLRWDYVKRPRHFDTVKLGEVYFSLLQFSGSDRNMTDPQLKELIDGALKYKKNTTFQIINSEVAKVLTQMRLLRKDSPIVKDAVKYAQAGVADAEAMIKSNPAYIAQKMDISLRGNAKMQLADVYLKEGNLDEAEKLLLEIQSTIPNGVDAAGSLRSLAYLLDNAFAELYEEKKDYDRAESYLLKNVTGRESSDMLRFRLFYQKKNNNSREGFEGYWAKIKEKIDLKLKNELLSSRIKNPKNLAPFNLQTIEGKPFSSDELKGKVAVINFWGTWCAPCVAEMPDFQKLADKYKNDKDVMILTMDANDELADVKKFMADKKYNFPVLLGDSYTGNIMFNGGIAFPTTLFVGKDGKIEFIKVANSPRLFEEFSWRIDVLKEGK